MNRRTSHQFSLFLSIGMVATLLLAGCGGGSSSTVAQFTPSATTPTPGLVKLVPKTTSGSRAVVDVLIFGPEPNLDLFDFQFGVKIGDTSLVTFVPQDAYIQTALVPGAGQTIDAIVDGASDPSVVSQVIVRVPGSRTAML